jgi:hypothetical protein
MATKVISELAINKIKGNNILVAKLMMLFDRTQNTIENWMNDKDVRLITPDAVRIISEETRLTEDEIIEQEAVKA